MDVQGWIDDGQRNVQQPRELEEAAAEGVHVGLQRLGKVNQQVLRPLPSAHDVHTRRHDVDGFAALTGRDFASFVCAWV